MNDTSKTAMVTLGGGEKTPQPFPHESAWEMEPIAASAIKECRGNRSQIEIARAAGISQGFLSELESGRKRLTPRVARKLAPVLGMTANQLVLAEHLATLNRIAQMVRIDLQPLLVEVERLSEIMPGGEVGDAIMDALVRIARERQKTPN